MARSESSLAPRPSLWTLLLLSVVYTTTMATTTTTTNSGAPTAGMTTSTTAIATNVTTTDEFDTSHGSGSAVSDSANTTTPDLEGFGPIPNQAASAQPHTTEATFGPSIQPNKTTMTSTTTTTRTTRMAFRPNVYTRTHTRTHTRARARTRRPESRGICVCGCPSAAVPYCTQCSSSLYVLVITRHATPRAAGCADPQYTLLPLNSVCTSTFFPLPCAALSDPRAKNYTDDEPSPT